MKQYIFDTNFFFNMENDSGFGNNSQEVFEQVTEYARKISKDSVSFLMPPSIVTEIHTFLDEGTPFLTDFLSHVTVKAPEKHNVTIPAQLMYEIVQDIRQRSYRGLQIAEEELQNVASEFHTLNSGEMSELDDEQNTRIAFQKKIGQHITKLRDRYRNATRTKFLDSTADLDVIMLAREVDGVVVSSDEGVIEWARRFGVKEAIPRVLKQQLDHHLQA